MTRAAVVAAALVLVACAGQAQSTCTPEARDALGTFYARVAGEVIEAGACDKYADVAQCPAYLAVETHYLAARKGICP